MSADFNSPVLLRSRGGLTRTADRLIVDQEVVGSNPAPSIPCHSTTQYSPLSPFRLESAGQAFLSTSVDSIENKNFVAGLKDTLVRVMGLSSFESPAAFKLVTGVAERVDAKL